MSFRTLQMPPDMPSTRCAQIGPPRPRLLSPRESPPFLRPPHSPSSLRPPSFCLRCGTDPCLEHTEQITVGLGPAGPNGNPPGSRRGLKLQALTERSRQDGRVTRKEGFPTMQSFLRLNLDSGAGSGSKSPAEKAGQEGKVRHQLR